MNNSNRNPYTLPEKYFLGTLLTLRDIMVPVCLLTGKQAGNSIFLSSKNSAFLKTMEYRNTTVLLVSLGEW